MHGADQEQDVAAIVLAGGAARRLGGRSKPDLEIGGRRLLDIVLDATSGATPRVVVAGPEVAVPAGVLRVQEDPPRSGPAAGILAGLAAIAPGPIRPEETGSPGPPEPAGLTLVLACDLPGADGLVDRLLGAVATLPASGDGADGAILVHPDGTREWLAALVRTDALAGAGEQLGDPANRSVRSLLGRLSLTELPGDGLETRDVDTPADHRRAEQVRAGGLVPGKPPLTGAPVEQGPYADRVEHGHR